MSRICRPNRSLRRTPVTASSHTYSPTAVLCTMASAITLATSYGEVVGMGYQAVGGLVASLSGGFVAAQRWEWTNRNPAESAMVTADCAGLPHIPINKLSLIGNKQRPTCG
jgi:hypothetical protein